MRKILIATFGESSGDDAVRTLLPLIAVTTLGAGGAFLGVLNALPFLWYLVAHRQIGAAVDALGYRRSVMIGNGTRVVTVVVLIALLTTGALSPAALIATAAVIGLGDALFTTGHSVMIPAIVGPERTAACYQRVEAVSSVARVSGPALASWMLRVATQPVALCMAAVAYLLSLVTLSTLRSPAPVDHPAGPHEHQASDDVDQRWTVREVLSTRGLSHITVSTSLLNASAMISGTALVLFSLVTLGLAPATVALLAAAGALGGLVGAACAHPLRIRFSTGTGKLLATTGVAATCLVAPTALLVPHGQAVIVLLGEFLVALFATASSVIGSDVPALLIPQKNLGRAFAAIRLLTIGVMPVASVAGGLLISVSTPFLALICAAGVTLIACWPLLAIRGWSPPRDS